MAELTYTSKNVHFGSITQKPIIQCTEKNQAKMHRCHFVTKWMLTNINTYKHSTHRIVICDIAAIEGRVSPVQKEATCSTLEADYATSYHPINPRWYQSGSSSSYEYNTESKRIISTQKCPPKSQQETHNRTAISCNDLNSKLQKVNKNTLLGPEKSWFVRQVAIVQYM